MKQPTTVTATVIRLGIAAACSLFILALLIHFVSGSHEAADRPQLFALLRDTSLTGVLTYLCLHLTGIVIRALRYRLLLSAADEPSTPGIRDMILVTGFRNMVVDMLPSRLGELGYVAILNRAYGVGAGACFSSLAVSTVFDFIALAILIGLMIVALLIGGGLQGWLFGALIMAILISVVGVLSLTRIAPWITSRLEQLSGDSGIRRWIGKLADLSRAVVDALEASRRAGVMGKTLALSLAIRATKYLSLFILFMAVAGPSIPALADADGSSVLAAIIGAEIGASLPIPTLMSFGSYEAGGTLVFSLLGVEAGAGLIALLATHIWSQVIDYSIGGICLALVIWLVGRSRNHSSAPTTLPGSRWKLAVTVAAIGALVLGSAVAAAFQLRGIQKMGSFTAPPRGESLRGQDPVALSETTAALAGLGAKGIVVWSSNRSGNHDILSMELETGEIRALTDHPHTETWPRLSGDGSRMLFTRSRSPWVSQRNAAAWDTWLLDLESGEEIRIAEQASYPFWIDGETIGYLSEGRNVMQQSLDQDAPTPLLIPGGGSPVRSGVQITSPSYNKATGTLSFTGKQSAIGLNTGYWGTALWQVDGEQLRGVHQGCQLYWSADNTTLYQIGHGGRQETQLFEVNPETLEATPILDLPGEFSHEYWPNDDLRGEFLVFGASRGDHEHDTADYEIFLWRKGDPAESAVRLTFHTGNDNWPDLFTEQ